MRFVAVAVAALLMNACTSTTENDADITFAQQMVPHHEQAIEMGRLVAEADADPEVQDLAAQIEKAQGPEIETLNGWLEDWGVPSSQHEGMSMEHESGVGDGMMSRAQMADLDRASGAEFDRLWLTLMIEHHQGAITMARREVRDGKNREAINLAQQIIDGQTAEIDRMKELIDE